MLRNDDMQDRELLYAIDAVAGEDNLTSRDDLAGYLNGGGGADDPAFLRAISTRLAWMKRYGFVERIDPKTIGLRASDPPRYIITAVGRALMSGRLTKTVTRELDAGDPGTQLLLMRELGRRGYVDANDTVASAIRREWTAHVNRRFR